MIYISSHASLYMEQHAHAAVPSRASRATLSRVPVVGLRSPMRDTAPLRHLGRGPRAKGLLVGGRWSSQLSSSHLCW
jgi:hypothetical protein